MQVSYEEILKMLELVNQMKARPLGDPMPPFYLVEAGRFMPLILPDYLRLLKEEDKRSEEELAPEVAEKDRVRLNTEMEEALDQILGIIMKAHPQLVTDHVTKGEDGSN